MKKLKFLSLVFAALLVSGGVWAVTRTASDLESLKDAIAAAETGDVIQLTGSIDGATTSGTGALVPIDKSGVSFTLDLNGNHITGGYSGASAGTLLITAGDVTIKDSGTGGYLGTAGSKYVVNINKGAKATLNSGIIYGACYLVYNYGDFTMNNGSIIAQNSSTCYAAHNGGVANFYDGCVKATCSGNLTVYAVSTNVANRTNIFGGKFGSFGSKATKDVSNASFVGGGMFVHSVDYSDGYVVNDISEEIDGVTYTKEVVPASSATMVAEVGSTQYSSLAKAFLDAPDNSTIRLISPVSINSLGINSPEGKILTLDLNNQSITDADHAQASTYSSGRIRAFGNLTITDESNERGGTIFVNGKSANTYGLSIPKGGKLTIDNGHIIGQDPVAGKGIFLTYVDGGELEVNGGTMKVQTTTTGNAVVAQIGSAGNVTLNGGNFHIKADSPYGFGFIYGLKGKVKGGIFTCEGVTNTSYFVAGSEVTGGQFNFDPSTYIPLGDKMLKSDSTDKVSPFGTELTLQYSVVTNPNPTMMVKNVNTGVDYASPFEAISAANTGDELRLLEDMNIGEFSLMLNKPLTLDINGKALSSNTSTIVIASGDANDPVVITDKAQVKGSITGKKSIAIDNINGLNVAISDVVLYGTATNCIHNNSFEATINISNVTGTVSGTSYSTISVLHSAKKAYISITNCDFLINCPNATVTTSGNSVSVIYYQHNEGSCTINGGTYKAISKTTQANIIKYMYLGAPVTIYDGKFAIESQDASKVAFYGSGSSGAKDKAKPSIQGGYFTMDPTNWVPSTHGVVNNPQEEPNYAYKVVEQDACSVAGVNYSTVHEAVAAVEADPSLGAITLLRNVSIQNPLEISSNITFAETSYTMTLNGNPSIILKTGATMPSCIAAPMEASAPKEGKTYYYTTFYNAFSNNSAIQLEKDVTYSNILRINGDTKTIDLNGHTLSGNQSYSFIELKYWYGPAVLNLINTAQQVGIVKNNSAVLNSHVIDLDQGTGMVYSGSYAKVVVGQNVKLQGETGIEMWRDSTYLDVYGSIESTGFAIAGNGSEDHWGTDIRIFEGANLYASAAPAIYHPQDGTLIIEGGTISGYQSAVEIRSGTVDITGGTLISRYVSTEQETNPNSNGTTTTGVGIAVVQHVTENPITVNISGNTVVQAIMPVKLANPQENEGINTVQVNINGGKYATTQGASNVFWSANKNFAVSAGKFSHVPAYVVEGKAVVANEDDDKLIYPYKIGEVSSDPIIGNDKNNITWEVNTDWKNENVPTEHQIPTSQDMVNISNEQIVTVTGKTGGSGAATEGAFAYSIDIADGGQLIVKSGAKLVVGKGGINEADKSDKSVIVEDGGVLLIEPTADVAEETGKVEYIAKTFKRNDGWEECYDHGYQLDLFGNPIEGETTIAADPIGCTVWLNTWDPNNGWQISDLATFKASTFTGFMFWNNRPVDSTRVKYTFSGKLVGNQVNTMQFAQDGYKCFANSYTAPIDVKALLQGVEGDLQRAVYIYLPETDQFIDINNAKLQVPAFEYRQIAPMQGFFVRNLKDTTLTAPIDYVSMVWGPAFPGGSGAPAAPARDRNAIDQTQVRINLTDNTAQRTDYVFLVEGEQYSAERDASDIEKMMNSTKGVNIYANTQLGALSTMQTNDLDGQALSITTNPSISYSMSFDWVAGEDLYLYDAEKKAYTRIAEDASYEFVANASSTIDNRFYIVKRAPQVTTDIVEVEKTTPAVKGVYSITGQFLGDASMWHTLPAGVYVVDGQKIVK